MSTHPIVVILQTVDADCHRMHARLQQCLQFLGRQGQSVAHHAPRESTFVDATSAFHDVAPHERFASRYDDEHLVGIGLCSNRVQHSEEVLTRHVGLPHCRG